MGKFILGVIVTLLVLILGGLGFAMLGFFPTNANVAPPHLETRVAMGAVDASMARHAPRLTNPLQPTDQNFEDGMKLYTMNCALCHGGLDRKPSSLSKSFYPPAPNLVSDPPDDPEWHVFYTIRTGVRYTGMPSWEKTLSEQEMWKIATFLSHMQKLPPNVQDYWKTNFGVSPPTGEEEKMEQMH
jgi:thiosulfate dehydrogenase